MTRYVEIPLPASAKRWEKKRGERCILSSCRMERLKSPDTPENLDWIGPTPGESIYLSTGAPSAIVYFPTQYWKLTAILSPRTDTPSSSFSFSFPRLRLM